MTRLDVLLFSWNLPGGGLLKTIYEEYSFFERQGRTVNLISCKDAVPKYYKEIFLKMKPVVLSPTRETPTFLRTRSETNRTPALSISPFALLEVTKFLLKNKPRLLICHEFGSGMLAFVFTLFNKHKTILVLHDTPFALFSHDNSTLNSGLKALGLLLLKKSINLFGSVVCTTKAIKNSLKSFGIKRELLVAEYGVKNCPGFKPNNAKKIVLALAKWTNSRKPETYLEIARRLPSDVEFLIAGHWDNEVYRSEIVEKAKQINVQGWRIDIRSDLTEEEVHQLYHTATVFLRLSFAELGTGQGILDAVGHGIPLVLGKDLGALGGFTDGVHGYIVDSSDLVTIVDRIKTVLFDSGKWHSFSSNVISLGVNYDWAEYCKVLEGSAGGAKR